MSDDQTPSNKTPSNLEAVTEGMKKDKDIKSVHNENERGVLARDARDRERDSLQRYKLRWFVVGLTFVVMVLMGYMIASSACIIFDDPSRISSGYIAAAFIAPIGSITALSISLLVAAFRGFKKIDKNTVSDGVIKATQLGTMSD